MMMRALALLLTVSVATGCPGSSNRGDRPRDPPQVFLTATEASVVGTEVKLRANVNGCDRVQQLQLFDRETFLKDVPYDSGATDVTLAGQEIGPLFPKLGIAADLSLALKATCDDGRTNVSQATPVRFFPVAKVVAAPEGELVVPQQFFAEGGLNGSDPTFVGCIQLEAGIVALARVDATGKVLAQNASLPFACSGQSQVTERHTSSGKRWLWERGVGAMAFDAQLNVTASVLGSFYALEVMPDGDAIVWDSKAIKNAVRKVAHQGATVRWSYQPRGILMGSPKYFHLGHVLLPVFVDELGAYNGKVTVQALDWLTGLEADQERVLTQINYPFGNSPDIPPASFSEDGSTLYFVKDVSSSTAKASTVLACATTQSDCGVGGAARRWESQLLQGLVLATQPFAKGSRVAAVAAQRLYFLDAAKGEVKNKGGEPILPSGALVAREFQAGQGLDFYLLSGPPKGWPSEVVAVDAAENGEVLRYEMIGGASAGTAMTMAIDDAGQPWLRIGPDLVKPLPLSQYRAARGN